MLRIKRRKTKIQKQKKIELNFNLIKYIFFSFYLNTFSYIDTHTTTHFDDTCQILIEWCLEEKNHSKKNQRKMNLFTCSALFARPVS